MRCAFYLFEHITRCSLFVHNIHIRATGIGGTSRRSRPPRKKRKHIFSPETKRWSAWVPKLEMAKSRQTAHQWNGNAEIVSSLRRSHRHYGQLYAPNQICIICLIVKYEWSKETNDRWNDWHDSDGAKVSLSLCVHRWASAKWWNSCRSNFLIFPSAAKPSTFIAVQFWRRIDDNNILGSFDGNFKAPSRAPTVKC